MNNVAAAAAVIGYLATFGGAAAFLGKLWQQCQLRNDITAIYYRHCGEETPALREYERKNLDDLYGGYKALGGNHFIDDLYHAMRDWRVVS